MIRNLPNKILRILFHPGILAIVISFIWEWKRMAFSNVNDFLGNPVSGIIGFAILYGFGYLVAIGIHKLFSSNDFLSETKLRDNLDELIREAKEHLYVISPYLDPGNLFIEGIIDATRRGVKVILLHNSNQNLKVKTISELRRLIDAGVAIYSHPRLHAKIYMSESEVIITSLNLVSGSFTDSFEAGIRTNDRAIRKE